MIKNMCVSSFRSFGVTNKMSKNKTVLVISDGHEQFALAASMLRDDGYCVLFENDIAQGLALAKAETPQLIISELAVPKVDGLELCCRVRDDNTLGGTSILLVGDLSKQSPTSRIDVPPNVLSSRTRQQSSSPSTLGTASSLIMS